ncbi:MAG: MFS transporter [Methylococcales bacterium]|jgi:NNP family nitrate/nitrite transporter-like MFS transporter|nr:MFS transporter [Methylococcales bacterium]
MSNAQFNLFKISDPKIKTLHLTWFAFFISFMVWFSHAPLLAFIRDSMGLSDQEIKVLLILNVAFTIPARIIVGILVDKYGPKQLFSSILILGGLVSIGFACAQTYQQLAIIRFFLGFIGAGFVVGIRMISEWFPARQTGIAQGIYGGWGNFGSAGAALILPALTLYFGGADGWRYAIATTGCIAILYGIIYYFSVSNTPKGSTYFRPKKTGAMEVSSKKDLLLYLLMNLPMYLTLAVLIWKLTDKMHWLPPLAAYCGYGLLTILYLYQTWKVIQVNKLILTEQPPELLRYAFSQVAILNLCYLLTFGTELAVVSMLPLFYVDHFDLDPILAGLLAGIYPVINLFARPAGGWLSDKMGRKITLVIATLGISATFLSLGQFTSDWPLWVVVAGTIIGGIFSKGGSGAVYAMVPLIQRRMTGQIAGMTGAFGNIGGVMFLTVLSFVTPGTFFMVIGAMGVTTLMLITLILKEPKGQMAEVMPDGTVHIIDISKD